MSELLVENVTSPQAERLETPAHPRLRRMRFLSKMLDNSIPLPGGYRIGLDPIIGLAPGIGDLITTSLSLWLIYDAAMLGLPKRILGVMVANVALETMTGSVPLVGDVVDAVWKANARNMQLTELHYNAACRPRSPLKVFLTFFAILLCFWSVIALGVYFAFRTIGGFLQSLFAS